jgi:hypothetical protein
MSKKTLKKQINENQKLNFIIIDKVRLLNQHLKHLNK